MSHGKGNREIDELVESFPSTVDPSRSFRALPHHHHPDRSPTPPPPEYIQRLFEAKQIFESCLYRELNDRVAVWIQKLAETNHQAYNPENAAVDDGLGDYDTNDKIEIAEAKIKDVMRILKAAGDDRWKQLQTWFDEYLDDKKDTAGSPPREFSG